jgi:hypothetical protein
VNDVNKCYKLKLFFQQFFINTAVLNAEVPLNSRLHILEVRRRYCHCCSACYLKWSRCLLWNWTLQSIWRESALFFEVLSCNLPHCCVISR